MSKPRKHKPLQFMLLILLILLMILSFSMSFIPVGHAQEPETDVIRTSDGLLCAKDQVLVKFKPTVSDYAAKHTLSTMSSEALDTTSDMIIADVPAGETVDNFAETLEAQPNVQYAQPNYLYTFESVSVNDTYVGYQWHLETMGVFDAWTTTLGSSNVIVAVLDTGVDLNHPDLVGRFVNPTDVVDNDSAQDDDGHGTHVAGIISAVTNNSKGVAGIAPGAKLMPVDVFGHYNTGSGTVFGALTSEVIEGIDYAVSKDADVINISLGGSDYDSAFEDAIDNAVSKGVVVVSAAGNKGQNGTHYPSDYDSCISVIATDWNDAKASYSNYGEDKDICAPGGDTNTDQNSDSFIFSTSYDPSTQTSGYAWMDGTSMASPMVAGVVALMLSANPNLKVSQVKDILYNTAVDLGAPGRDDDSGYGRVNAAAAVAAAAKKNYIPVPVTGVALKDSSLSLAPDVTCQLYAKVSPLNASNKAVVYFSSNEAVATVNPSGLITAVGAGNSIITVKTIDGNLTSSCNITVTMASIPVTGVSISGFSPEAHTLHFKGDSFNITPIVAPQNATNKAVKFESSTPTVATVDTTGIINVVGIGSTNITVTTLEKGLSSFIVLDVAKRGDANGDGNVSIMDYSLIRLHILGLKPLSDAYKPVADVDNNGNVSISDYTLVRLQILGLKSID